MIVRMDIFLNKEHGRIKHSFLYQVKSGTKKTINIVNAGHSPYSKGWTCYAPFESVDQKHWTRLKPGRFDGRSFVFEISDQAKYVCWFPPYNIQQMMKICASFQKAGNDAFFMGNTKNPTLIFLAGQHPAETMGLYFLEGILKAARSNKNFFKHLSILVFPYINKQGMQHQNHRLTPNGTDLNRDWKNPCNPILNSVKKAIQPFSNILAVIDIHGDEVSSKDYVIYNKNFKGTNLEKCCREQEFLLLKKQNFWKKCIKALIQQKRIPTLFGKTARDYFEKKDIPAITIELSASKNTPESCLQKGKSFVDKLLSLK